jgi:hypothetical protein
LIMLIDKELPFNPPKHYGGLKSTFHHSRRMAWIYFRR